jgi:hypothetical protein
MLTAQDARDRLDYDPATGILRWKIDAAINAFAGSVAGSVDRKGYIVTSIQNRRYYAHRLAWLIMTGEMPPDDIDHIDGNPGNNAWTNLRLASKRENNRNVKARASNKLGVKGVRRRYKDRFVADICVNGRTIYLGSFATIEEASAAYQKAAREHFGDFAWEQDRGSAAWRAAQGLRA